MIQLGTTLAVVLYFAKDLWRIASAWARSLRRRELRGSLDARLGWYIGLGTIPIAVLGVLLKDQVTTAARNLWVVATALIVLGLVLEAADRYAGRRQGRRLEQVTLRDGLLVGSAQALALVPGVSRSGSTITAGLFLGLTRQTAARFSFLLSTPAIVLSALFDSRGSAAGPCGRRTHRGVATVVAFVVGLATIA